MNELNPLTLPLTSNALIEASAGTGKTYTITTLYLRAILGLRDSQLEQLQPLSIDQILVVTFTEAATQELRDRIRSKLKDAQNALLEFMADDSTTNIDFSLKLIIEQYSSLYMRLYADSSREIAVLSAYHKIQDAITLIDEASIFTIHGFCQRCLNQFAFETKMAFEQSFEMDNRPYVKQALYDFWRQHAVPLSGIEYQLFRSRWPNPSKLLSDIAELLNKQVIIEPSLAPIDYQNTLSKFIELTTALHNELQTSDFFAVLKDAGVNGRKQLITKLPVLEDFAQRPVGSVALSLDLLTIWCSENVADASNYKKGHSPIGHSVTGLFDQLAMVGNKLLDSQFDGYWLTQAKQFIEVSALGIKAEQQLLTPDDLLLQLQQALSDDKNSEALIRSIKLRYPLAFIDEFQDTDPVQYDIFNCLYQPSEDQDVTGNMIMIGDPKQAIYRFRGADIFTYIKAKNNLSDQQHFTLSTNWRSHRDLIKAINHFFETSPNKFEDDSIPFIPVGSGKDDSVQLIEDGAVSPKLEIMHFSALDAEKETDTDAIGYSLSEIQSSIAQQCALDIATLLKTSELNTSYFEAPSGNKTAVQANDIAVLVRNRRQAKLIKNTLNELGVRSVYISRDSVFDNPLAKDLLRLLEAIHTPINERKVKAAVATDFFCYSLEQLYSLQHDSKSWHQHLVCFHQAHEFWSQGKISTALNYIIDFADTYACWQRDNYDFERQVTDYRHLLELVQQESIVQNGPEKLMAWLRQTVIENAKEANEEVSMRLESDNNLVQIITMHGSKGLEYPIVYIPFATEFKAQLTALHHSKRLGGLSLRVDKRKIEMQLAEQERLSEDIRLLYVAMTRAKQRLVLGCFNLKAKSNSKTSSVEKSAFGRLILGRDTNKPSELNWQQALKNHFVSLDSEVAKLRFIEPNHVKTAFDDVGKHSENAQSVSDVELSCNQFHGEIDQNWRILSYSALVGSGEHFIAGATDEQSSQSDNEPNSTFDINNQTRFTFPKGANPGSCLHHMFEHLDFTVPVIEQTKVIEDALQLFGLDDELVNGTSQWLQSVLETNIDDWSLSHLNKQARLDEMEFYFDVQSLNGDIIGNALRMCGFDSNNINTNVLRQSNLKGLIKGFIDLTAVVDNQYYVIDYKSNFLGDNFDAYDQGNLKLAMTDHNYHLQLIIYSYALHKWLSLKIVDYDYDKHVAGGIYLFVRGMSDMSINTGVYRYKVPFEVIQFLDNALQSGANKHG